MFTADNPHLRAKPLSAFRCLDQAGNTLGKKKPIWRKKKKRVSSLELR
jgi:hypothetical protein